MADSDTLYMLWTTGDPVTAKNMVFMYSGNSLRRKWWSRVHMLVWGAATKLLAEDPDIREEMKTFLELGGEVSVCLRCAENIGKVAEMQALQELGKFKVYYVGEFFTKILKDGERVVSV